MENHLNLLNDSDVDFSTDPFIGDAKQGDATEHHAQFFGPYQLIEQVGEGGVAKVYRARHIHPGYADKTFGVKILHDELSRNPKVVELFRAEAYVLSILKHANIVHTFEAGTQDDRLFIAMEYIDGRNLDHLMVRCQNTNIHFPIPLALHMMNETLRALAFAHEMRDSHNQRLHLVHRDINPANVFLSFDGRVKLGDFGVASVAAGLNNNKELAGKAGYFAPEQLEGEDVDQRADLFSVGVMMFEVLCAQRLFQADSIEGIIKLNKKAKIPKPSKINTGISQDLEAVMLKALQRKPNDRFASSDEMLAALQPLVPDQNGMPLGVAALLRTAFNSEHTREMQLNEGLSGADKFCGSGQLLGVYSGDERTRSAFEELLSSKGYRTATYETPTALGVGVKTQDVRTVLVDVAAQAISPDIIAQELAGVDESIAIIGYAKAMTDDAIKRADAIGAVDLLVQPLNIDRVLTSVRAAITGVARVATLDPITSSTVRRIKPKVFIVSSDEKIARRMYAGLIKRGYAVEILPSAKAGLERAHHASPCAIVFDTLGATCGEHSFADELRQLPGMGLVPILYLTADVVHPHALNSNGPTRTAIRSRLDPPAVITETLNRLRGDTRLGRTFLRYATDFPAEIRYGGRSFSAEAIDISRGGVMIRFNEQMPPIGTEVSLNLYFPTSKTCVGAKGRVAHVDLPADGNAASQVGVEFERFTHGGESGLVCFLASLGDQ